MHPDVISSSGAVGISSFSGQGQWRVAGENGSVRLVRHTHTGNCHEFLLVGLSSSSVKGTITPCCLRGAPGSEGPLRLTLSTSVVLGSRERRASYRDAANRLQSHAAQTCSQSWSRHQACLAAQEMPVVAGPRVTLSLGSGVRKQADSPPLAK